MYVCDSVFENGANYCFVALKHFYTGVLTCFLTKINQN